MTTPVKKQAFADIDLDITHYDTDELLTMFNLRDPTEDDIMSATTRLINKANADRLSKVAAFFQQAQDALLDELDKQSPPLEDTAPSEADADQDQAEDPEDEATDDTNRSKKGSDQLGQWWRNEYLKQADKVQADKPADRKNKIQVLQGNQHMPTKREKLGINETFQVPVAQGTLNPNLKNTVTRLVNIDSQYRQIITPNSENPLGPASPTNYTFDLTENLTNVLSIKLNSVQIPYTWYAIDVTSGTNVLFYKLTAAATYTPFVVPPGNYTPTQLQAYMSTVYPFNATIFSIVYGANDGKFKITNVSASSYDILFFDPAYNVPVAPSLMTSDINDAIAASKLNSNLGWLMGFRGTNVPNAAPNTLIYNVFPNFWVAAGQGTNTLAYSTDGNIWTASANGNAIFIQCNTVAWNGQIWVAGGSGITTLAYSLDGITWIASANGISIISTQCSTVAWSGQLQRWVAGGQGTNTLAYSSDGITWSSSANGNTTFTTECSTVAWNGQRWVAGGQGTNVLAYSSDGINWIASANGNTTFTTECSTVAWNGQQWIAGGQGTNVLAYSSDGNTWVPSANGNATFSSVNAIASEEHAAIVTEALADTYGPKYLILVLDDYNQNHLNKGLVTIATNDTKLSIPSYFTPSLPVICDASNNPFYVQSSPRNLTQAQLFTINTIIQDRNNTTIDRYTGPTTTDVLTLIPVKTYSLLPGQPYIEFGSALQTNERVYFGPVNIERIKVQLIDDKGNILNMHGNDWSFTIVSTHLYEY